MSSRSSSDASISANILLMEENSASAAGDLLITLRVLLAEPCVIGDGAGEVSTTLVFLDGPLCGPERSLVRLNVRPKSFESGRLRKLSSMASRNRGNR